MTTSISFADFSYSLDPQQFVVCGIDEAGRGPLMGDVVAACVVLDHTKIIAGLNDSKKLSEKKRDELAPLIKEQAVACGIGKASPQEIDELNILNATYLAMFRAYEAMGHKADLALIDGNRLPKDLVQAGVRCESVVKGDAKVVEIAAASILAKTTRDADLYALDQQYSQYGFAHHKGYPTAEHLKLLESLEILPCYRKSYSPVRKLWQERFGVDPMEKITKVRAERQAAIKAAAAATKAATKAAVKAKSKVQGFGLLGLED